MYTSINQLEELYMYDNRYREALKSTNFGGVRLQQAEHASDLLK